MSKAESISIVVPVFNEEDSLKALYERLSSVLDAMGMPWEVILVDDGSRDGSTAIMRELNALDSRVHAIFLSRNFGHETASTAGLEAASGDWIVLMDADLQDPPECIPVLLAKCREGFDMVYARRASREGETLFKKVSAFLFYRIMADECLEMKSPKALIR